ncbi:MAG TPA: 16S rRNA (cytosine(1402)-N(4))-methyltransferase RsmH [Actinobacteria bacterium]|nr:16S rRNA (cytosine(1402)-N(4))-methyltransferase RsmH [Actinomycetes bacterium]HEX21439.1 16S rRNA (cytosine(1402)-N(4))-methyltransferase RsmH [Actinomycetota bacterium]
MTREYHKPVLLAEVLQQLTCRRGSAIVDCTLGGAGHAEAILNLISPEGVLIGIDEDKAAIEAAKGRLARFSQQTFIYKSNFAKLDDVLKQVDVGQVDGFLFDLGVSSAQLDQVDRGFSYNKDSPLDMRMDRSTQLTAADIVNNYDKKELTKILHQYGEEKWAGRIGDFIVDRRRRQRIETSRELVEIIKAAIPASARRHGGNPAKRTFQALRIEVNQELNNLKIALESAFKWLKPGGRLVVISYHSLEDRIVKKWLRQKATACVCPPEIPICVCGRQSELKILTPKLVRPTSKEIADNPRAKSAKMRVGGKL